jgi:hypothetical protein
MNTIIEDGDLHFIHLSNFSYQEDTYQINPPIAAHVSYNNSIQDYYGDAEDYEEMVIYTSRIRNDGRIGYTWTSNVHGITSNTSISNTIASVFHNVKWRLSVKDAIQVPQAFIDRVSRCKT